MTITSNQKKNEVEMIIALICKIREAIGALSAEIANIYELKIIRPSRQSISLDSAKLLIEKVKGNPCRPREKNRVDLRNLLWHDILENPKNGNCR